MPKSKKEIAQSHEGRRRGSVITATDDQDLKMPLRDSYSEFLGGIWKWFPMKSARRYIRWVMSDRVRKEEHWKGKRKIEAGWVQTVNERVDPSVIQRCQLYPDYRPANLKEWAKRKGLDLEAVIAHPDQYPQCWSAIEKTGVETTA